VRVEGENDKTNDDGRGTGAATQRPMHAWDIEPGNDESVVLSHGETTGGERENDKRIWGEETASGGDGGAAAEHAARAAAEHDKTSVHGYTCEHDAYSDSWVYTDELTGRRAQVAGPEAAVLTQEGLLVLVRERMRERMDGIRPAAAPNDKSPIDLEGLVSGYGGSLGTLRLGSRVAVRRDVWDRVAAVADAGFARMEPRDNDLRRFQEVVRRLCRGLQLVLGYEGPVGPLEGLRTGSVVGYGRPEDVESPATFVDPRFVVVRHDVPNEPGALYVRWPVGALMLWDHEGPGVNPPDVKAIPVGQPDRYEDTDESFAARRHRARQARTANDS